MSGPATASRSFLDLVRLELIADRFHIQAELARGFRLILARFLECLQYQLAFGFSGRNAQGQDDLCRGLGAGIPQVRWRSEEHTSELQSHSDLVCRLLREKKKC